MSEADQIAKGVSTVMREALAELAKAKASEIGPDENHSWLFPDGIRYLSFQFTLGSVDKPIGTFNVTIAGEKPKEVKYAGRKEETHDASNTSTASLSTGK
jgi:hypothetical protein